MALTLSIPAPLGWGVPAVNLDTSSAHHLLFKAIGKLELGLLSLFPGNVAC